MDKLSAILSLVPESIWAFVSGRIQGLLDALQSNPKRFRRKALDALCDLNETLPADEFKRAICLFDQETLAESAAHNGFDLAEAINKRDAMLDATQAFAEVCRHR